MDVRNSKGEVDHTRGEIVTGMGREEEREN